MDTSRNDLLEFHPFKRAWVNAYSKFRGRQVKRKRVALTNDATAQQRALLAANAFPNNIGNYPGKRTPAPDGKPMAPRDRFFRMAAAYPQKYRPQADFLAYRRAATLRRQAA